MNQNGFLIRCFFWITVLIIVSVGGIYTADKKLLPEEVLVGIGITLALGFIGMTLAFFGVRPPKDPRERKEFIGFTVMMAGAMFLTMSVSTGMSTAGTPVVYLWLDLAGFTMFMAGVVMVVWNSTIKKPSLPKSRKE